MRLLRSPLGIGLLGFVLTLAVVIQLRNWQAQIHPYRIEQLQAQLATATEEARADIETAIAAEEAAYATYHFDLFDVSPNYDWGLPVVLALIGGLFSLSWAAGFIAPLSIFTGEPTLARGLWMMIIGFLIGMGVVFLLRGLQNLEPLWEPQVGMILPAFLSAGFFMWGMGAFDPSVNKHPHPPSEEEELALVEAVAKGDIEEAPAVEEAAEEEPARVFGSYVWMVAALGLGAFLLMVAVAVWPNGPGLKIVGAPEGDFAAFGTVEVTLPFNGPTIQTSQFVIFLFYTLFSVISLAVIAAIFWLVIYGLSAGITEVRNTKPSEEELIPPKPVQVMGRIFARIAWILRVGLPRFLGQK
ncbi:MAG: hypothetical protein D6712_01345 [Chloroflexi bacterium]|nr:MAG: hypothetical protein D6712_01345 [Chloroflexota bacterium]